MTNFLYALAWQDRDARQEGADLEPYAWTARPREERAEPSAAERRADEKARPPFTGRVEPSAWAMRRIGGEGERIFCFALYIRYQLRAAFHGTLCEET